MLSSYPVITATIIYAKQLINYSSYYERLRSSNVQQTPDIKEENVDSTEFALDEIVCSFLSEFLSVYTRFSISVRFFSLIK